MDNSFNGANLSDRDVTIAEGTVKADIKVVFKLPDGTTPDFTKAINRKLLQQLIADITP
ncbi:MAG: hypothetical protein ACYTBX_17440 [Planctomycetota bacterium]|jgi:hypothetical protein